MKNNKKVSAFENVSYVNFKSNSDLYKEVKDIVFPCTGFKQSLPKPYITSPDYISILNMLLPVIQAI